jgi:hypothetical protein
VVIEAYVIVCVAVAAFTWSWWPAFVLAVICSYFSLSTVVTLLQVVFLSKPLPGSLSLSEAVWLAHAMTLEGCATTLRCASRDAAPCFSQPNGHRRCRETLAR